MSRAEILAPEIGERLKKLRDMQDLSVADLAAALDLKPFALREIESGRNIMQWLKLAEFARLLKTTPDMILGYTPLSIEADRADEVRQLRSEITKLKAAIRNLVGD